MTLCYVLHQTHSKFWHIQYSAFLGICQHTQSYSALLTLFSMGGEQKGPPTSFSPVTSTNVGFGP